MPLIHKHFHREVICKNIILILADFFRFGRYKGSTTSSVTKRGYCLELKLAKKGKIFLTQKIFHGMQHTFKYYSISVLHNRKKLKKISYS